MFRAFQDAFRSFSAKLPSLVRAPYAQFTLEREKNMSTTSALYPLGKANPILAIGFGGLLAGTLDVLQACLLFGWDIPKVIAGGLLGPSAVHGGAGMYLLGLLLHYFIATTVAAMYYAASRKLTFLLEYPLICGLFYGMAVESVMNLIVLPLSALHARGPYQLHDLLFGYGMHMLVIGLPVAHMVRRYGRPA